MSRAIADGTVRLRMTLWNVAMLALILRALGGVVRYRVLADLFATVDRTLAKRAYAAEGVSRLNAES